MNIFIRIHTSAPVRLSIPAKTVKLVSWACFMYMPYSSVQGYSYLGQKLHIKRLLGYYGDNNKFLTDDTRQAVIIKSSN